MAIDATRGRAGVLACSLALGGCGSVVPLGGGGSPAADAGPEAEAQPAPAASSQADAATDAEGAGNDGAVVPAEASAPAPPNAQPDLTFATEGILMGSLSEWAPSGVAVDGQGRVLVSGPSYPADSAPVEVLHRLESDGSVDVGFGAAGRVAIPLRADEWAQTLRVLPDGRIGVLGLASVNAASDGTFVARLLDDGSLDPSFAPEPLLSTVAGPFASGAWTDDGGAYVLGASTVARCTSAGAIAMLAASGLPLPAAVSGTVDAGGRLWTTSGGRVSRYNADGSADDSFGAGGAVELPSPGSGFDTQALVLDGEGALVIGSYAGADTYFVDVARLGADGSLDPRFAAGAWTTSATSTAPIDGSRLSDGRVVVWTAGGELVLLQRDGTPIAVQSVRLLGGTVLAGTVDADGRLLLVGAVSADPFRATWTLRRYLLQ